MSPTNNKEGEIAKTELENAQSFGYSRTTFEVRSMDYGEPQHKIRTIAWFEPQVLTDKIGPPTQPTPWEPYGVTFTSLLYKPDQRPPSSWLDMTDATVEMTPPITVISETARRVAFVTV